MRGSDLVGRLGGEEFAAILTETSREKALAVAERIRETFAQMAEKVDGCPVCGTVSIGLVHCQGPTLDVTELLAQADHALYYAKERGRNRVEIASIDMVGDRRKFEATSTSSVGAINAKNAAWSGAGIPDRCGLQAASQRDGIADWPGASS